MTFTSLDYCLSSRAGRFRIHAKETPMNTRRNISVSYGHAIAVRCDRPTFGACGCAAIAAFASGSGIPG